MGAADVIPFVPLRGASMDDAIALARAFGRDLAEGLDLPVYLYDRAALLPERASLADVRKGEYEGLRDAVARGERLPDLGPHAIGPAGATAVGARIPLIAFNMYLSGRDEAAAKAIAVSVRESSGGMPALRAIGFAVPERACVTVSMNLVDHEVTGPARGVSTRWPPGLPPRGWMWWTPRSWGSCPRRRSDPGWSSTSGSRGSIPRDRCWSGWPRRIRGARPPPWDSSGSTCGSTRSPRAMPPREGVRSPRSRPPPARRSCPWSGGSRSANPATRRPSAGCRRSWRRPTGSAPTSSCSPTATRRRSMPSWRRIGCPKSPRTSRRSGSRRCRRRWRARRRCRSWWLAARCT